MNERLARLKPQLEQLYAAWNELMSETAGMLDRLASLGSAALSTAGGPLGLCLALASAYPSPEALEHDLEFLERAGLLEPHLSAALSTSR
ncbi:MAG: hypothetical protein QGH23_02090, partial [Dehalococcoidia bacterium]|nr:hypothetical protein [Dehalococcoidia bacterium]